MSNERAETGVSASNAKWESARDVLEVALAVHQRDLVCRGRSRRDPREPRTVEQRRQEYADALRPLRMAGPGVVLHIAAVEDETGSHGDRLEVSA